MIQNVTIGGKGVLEFNLLHIVGTKFITVDAGVANLFGVRVK
jgi:hypothetical protein